MFSWESMKWDVSIRRLRLVCFVLLASIVLVSCSQSISRSGESIDAVSARYEAGEAGDGEDHSASANESLAAQNNPLVDNQEAGQARQPLESSEAAPDRPSDGQDAMDSERDATASDTYTNPQASNPAMDGQGASNDMEIQGKPNESNVGNLQAADDKLPPTGQTTSTGKQDAGEWDGDNTLTFGELYASVGVRGIVLSDKVEALNNKEVEMSGYMAPPLTAGVRFFVLTKSLMAVCPFCSTDADWPTDIVVVYLPDGEEMNPTEHPVKVTGTLDTGSFTDEDTGFVSLVRIYADKVEVLN